MKEMLLLKIKKHKFLKQYQFDACKNHTLVENYILYISTFVANPQYAWKNLQYLH